MIFKTSNIVKEFTVKICLFLKSAPSACPPEAATVTTEIRECTCLSAAAPFS